MFQVALLLMCWFLFEIKLKFWRYSSVKALGNNNMSDEKIDEIDRVIVRKKKFKSLLFSSTVTSIVTIILLFIGYYLLVNKLSNNVLISTGILLALWLLLSGYVLRRILMFLTRSFYKECELTHEDMLLIILVVTVLCGLVSIQYSLEFSLMIFAIFLGRFVWLDTKIDNVFEQLRGIYNQASPDVSSLTIEYLAPILVGNIMFKINLSYELIIIVTAMSIRFVGMLTGNWKPKQ